MADAAGLLTQGDGADVQLLDACGGGGSDRVCVLGGGGVC